jgi:predicted dehydrogenase
MHAPPPLRWGILGTGSILAKYVEAFRLAHTAQVVAVASRDAGRARTAAASLGASRAYGSYDALLADPEIDVVVNALHNGIHCEWTVRALQAGKHVLCEKPLACSSAEVEEMFAAARANKRWLMEAFMFRYHPQIAMVSQQVHAGDIGQPLYIRASFMGHGPDRKNPRYWATAGGGALMDLGCYCVNLARLVAGCEPQNALAQAHFKDQTGVDLTLTGTLGFGGSTKRAAPSFLTAHLACSFESGGLYGADIVGTEGRITIPHPWLPPTWPAEYIVTRGGSTETVRVGPPDMPSHYAAPFTLEIEHFAACVRENRAPQFPPGVDAEQDSRANMRVIEALLESARIGKPVKVKR